MGNRIIFGYFSVNFIIILSLRNTWKFNMNILTSFVNSKLTSAFPYNDKTINFLKTHYIYKITMSFSFKRDVTLINKKKHYLFESSIHQTLVAELMLEPDARRH